MKKTIVIFILSIVAIYTYLKWQSSQKDVFAGAKDIFGGLEYNKGLWQSGYASFPCIARLVSHPQSPWWIHLHFSRKEYQQMTLARREIEDIGISLYGGVIQAWWGGRRSKGVRLTLMGKLIAHNPQVYLEQEHHQIKLEVDKKHRITLYLDQKVALKSIAIKRKLSSGWIDISTRNSKIHWTKVNISYTPSKIKPSGMFWSKFPKEPKFSEYEKIFYGYQPYRTHLWNRWKNNFIPSDWPRLRWWRQKGFSPVTHGPILGKPQQKGVAIWARTKEPMEIEVIAGDIANNPIVLGEIATIAQRGNSGSTEILQWPFAAESASYSLRAQGKIVDTRINGNWPKLQKKWFTKRKNFQLAITYGDNLAPAVYPPSLSSWEQKCSSLDLLLHLGDFVYEQSYRRRLEVSHLDYLTILGTTIGQRNRSLPMVGVFDDHEIANDVLGCGEPHWFGTFPTGTNLPKINPWRVASRDVGTKAWENFVGWSTPIEKEYKKIPHIFGQGILSLDGTVFIKNRKVISQLKALDVSLLSSLIIWPKALPEKFTELLTEPAGVYRVKKVHHNGFSIDLSPIPRSLLKLWRKKKFAIDFSISKPRFGSLKLGTAELLLLDTRTEKGFWQVDAKQPGPSILGKRQKKWLLHKIKHSPASLLLIASSITFTFHNGFTLQKRDSWTAFGHERDVLLRTIAARNKPVLLLSGDLHASAIRQLNDKIYELVCGAWSNQTFSNISASQEPIKGFAAPRLLYSSSDGKEKRGWETHITFLEFSHTGQVKVIIFNIATEKVEYQKVLF